MDSSSLVWFNAMLWSRAHLERRPSPSPVKVLPPSHSWLTTRVKRLTPKRLSFHRQRHRPAARSGPTRFDRSITQFFTLMRRLLQFWATHVLLVFFLLAYSIAGASVYRELEINQESDTLAQVVKIRNQIEQELWEDCQLANVLGQTNWTDRFRTIVWGYSDILCSPDVWDASIPQSTRIWTLTNSIIFCFYTYTTIGYGDVTPHTIWGRLFTILYCFFGIPFSLFVLGDMGQVLQAALKRIYISGFMFYYFGRCCNLKFTPPCVIITRWATLFHCVSSEPTETMSGEMVGDEYTYRGSSAIYSSYSGDDSLYFLVGLRESDFVVPVKVGLILLAVYVITGSFVFSLYEEWDFFEALYFIFVSLTTIGFGDYLPQRMNPFIVFAYVLFGLALMSLFLGLLLEYCTTIWKKAHRKITSAWAAKITEVEPSALSPVAEDTRLEYDAGRLLDVILVDTMSVLQLSDKPSTSEQSSETKVDSSTSLIKTFDRPVALVQITDPRLLDYTLTEDTNLLNEDEELLAAARSAIVGSRRFRPVEQPSLPTTSNEPRVHQISEGGLYEYLKERMAAIQGQNISAQDTPKGAEAQFSSTKAFERDVSPRPPYLKQQRGVKRVQSATTSGATQDNASALPPWKPLTPLQQGVLMTASSRLEDIPDYSPLRRYEPLTPPIRVPATKQASFAAIPEVIHNPPHHWVRTHFHIQPGPSGVNHNGEEEKKHIKHKKEKIKRTDLAVPTIRIQPSSPPEDQQNEIFLSPRPITAVPRPPPPTPQHRSPIHSEDSGEDTPPQTPKSLVGRHPPHALSTQGRSPTKFSTPSYKSKSTLTVHPSESSRSSAMSPRSPTGLSPRPLASPKLLSPHSPASPRSLTPHSPASPQSLSPHPPTSPKFLSPHPPTSPKFLSPHPPASPQSLSPHPPTSPISLSPHPPASPKVLSPHPSASLRSLALRTSASPQSLMPRPSASPSSLSRRSPASPRSLLPNPSASRKSHSPGSSTSSTLRSVPPKATLTKATITKKEKN